VYSIHPLPSITHPANAQRLCIDVCLWEYSKFPGISNQICCFELVLQLDFAYSDIMRRTGTSGSANTRQKGRSTSNKALSARNKASTSNGDSLENSEDFSAEQMALYKVMRTQLAAKKKAVTAAQDEGTSILILKGCFGS
jgi:hypothetical protein